MVITHFILIIEMLYFHKRLINYSSLPLFLENGCTTLWLYLFSVEVTVMNGDNDDPNFSSQEQFL